MSRQLEGVAQTNLFRFYAHIAGAVPEVQWAFHVPNGGHRHISVAAQLKAQGVKAGVPDILIPVPSMVSMDQKTAALYMQANRLPAPAHYAGLAIELKVGTNRASEEQKRWQARFQQSGWRAVVCYGWEAAATETLMYFDQDLSKFVLW
jgi:hypothetical protein